MIRKWRNQKEISISFLLCKHDTCIYVYSIFHRSEIQDDIEMKQFKAENEILFVCPPPTYPLFIPLPENFIAVLCDKIFLII